MFTSSDQFFGGGKSGFESGRLFWRNVPLFRNLSFLRSPTTKMCVSTVGPFLCFGIKASTYGKHSSRILVCGFSLISVFCSYLKNLSRITFPSSPPGPHGGRPRAPRRRRRWPGAVRAAPPGTLGRPGAPRTAPYVCLRTF